MEAEKGKVYAEAEKRFLEERVLEVGKKLIAAEDKLKEAEVHKRLNEKEAQSYKDDVEEIQQKMEKEQDLLEGTASTLGALEGELAEARQAKEKMDDTVKGLEEELEKK